MKISARIVLINYFIFFQNFNEKLIFQSLKILQSSYINSKRQFETLLKNGKNN